MYALYNLTLFGRHAVLYIWSELTNQITLPLVLYTNIDQTLVNSFHGLLNCEIGGLECHVITTEYRTHVHYIHMYHLFCNALVHVIYSVVSGQLLQVFQTKKTCKQWVQLITEQTINSTVYAVFILVHVYEWIWYRTLEHVSQH